MTNDLSELIEIVGDSSLDQSQVQDAVNWIASKPEGLQMLKTARAIHGCPLKVIVDNLTVHPSYGLNGVHAVHINPSTVKQLTFCSNTGKQFQGSLERILAHEFTHAAQPEALHDFTSQRIIAEVTAEHLKQVIPWEQYIHRIKAAKSDDTLMQKVLEDIYDSHIEPSQILLVEKIKQTATNSEDFQNYLKRIEVPAIEFENLIANYKREPARSTDYVNSAILDSVFNEQTTKTISRNNFVMSSLSSFRERRAQDKNVRE